MFQPWKILMLPMPTALILVANLSMVSALAFGYPTPVDFDGTLLRWNVAKDDPPVLWEVVADDIVPVEFYRQFIEQSAELWGSVEGSYLRLAEADTENEAQITINLKSEIDGEEYSSGYSMFDSSDSTGPTHCSMTIHAGPAEYGIDKTILHEFGHCMGLGHSLVPQAIMSYSLDENSFALDTDDKAAIARLYPADGSKPGLPLGCSTGGTGYGLNYLLIIGLFLIPVAFSSVNLESLND